MGHTFKHNSLLGFADKKLKFIFATSCIVNIILSQMAQQSTSVLKKIWRYIKRAFIFFFISSFVYILICKWVMPPITFTQFVDWVIGYGLKSVYVSWDEFSTNVIVTLSEAGLG